ncbi:MAG: T9SS type A sorting domain-containing protein [candidate division Zixibacteria bacterium]|nr:T9SS type A sorting domain-containing protein [candidate division Zixibacteria bacterium]
MAVLGAEVDDDDPFTDNFTGYIPDDDSPGEVGYLAALDAMNDGTFWNCYCSDLVPGSWVLINVDGGIAPPFNQAMPEKGTVFRIIKTHHIPVDTFLFTADASQIRTSGPEGMSVYLQYKMYNKSDYPIDSFYFSFFAEPNYDVGLIACDTLDDLFMCYSRSDFVDEFGFWPPAVGCKIIHGLLTPSPGETAQFSGQVVPDYANLGMTSLGAYHTNNFFPDSPTESDWRILARSQLWGGEPYVYNGDTLTYIYSGDPVTGSGDVLQYSSWSGELWQSCGPVQFLPGDSQYILLKLAVGQGESRLESVVALREVLNMPFQIPTSVEDDINPTLPERFVLNQNYPNPFNAGTTIEYSLPRRSHVTIEVFNVLGQRVRSLVDREMSAGSYTISWNGTNVSGQLVASGVYLYRFQAGDHIETKKMQLLK